MSEEAHRAAQKRAEQLLAQLFGAQDSTSITIRRCNADAPLEDAIYEGTKTMPLILYLHQLL